MPPAFGRRSSNAQSTLGQVPTSSSLSSNASAVPLPGHGHGHGQHGNSMAYSNESQSPVVSPSLGSGSGNNNPFEQQQQQQQHPASTKSNQHHAQAPSTATSSTFASSFAGGSSLVASISGPGSGSAVSLGPVRSHRDSVWTDQASFLNAPCVSVSGRCTIARNHDATNSDIGLPQAYLCRRCRSSTADLARYCPTYTQRS